MTNPLEWLPQLIDISKQAGQAIMQYYQKPHLIEHKQDGSPVTEADMAAHRLIVNQLATLSTNQSIAIFSEESRTLPKQTVTDSLFWLVDPLDGTKAFIQNQPEFTVNIALIKDQQPWLGIIYCPVSGIIYYGMAGNGAYKQVGSQARFRLEVEKTPPQSVTITAGHPMNKTEKLQTLIGAHSIDKILTVKSSLKFCLLAEGTAHFYPRYGRTMEWDTAAGHAILSAAGGHVVQFDLSPMQYGKQGLANPSFIASTLPLSQNR